MQIYSIHNCCQVCKSFSTSMSSIRASSHLFYSLNRNDTFLKICPSLGMLSPSESLIEQTHLTLHSLRKAPNTNRSEVLNKSSFDRLLLIVEEISKQLSSLKLETDQY